MPEFVQDVDGCPLERSKAQKLSKQMFYAGFLLLPWMWLTSVWYFWPDFWTGADPVVCKYTRRSAACFVVVTAAFLSWMLTFSIGGSELLGHKLFDALNLRGLDLYALGLLHQKRTLEGISLLLVIRDSTGPSVRSGKIVGHLGRVKKYVAVVLVIGVLVVAAQLINLSRLGSSPVHSLRASQDSYASGCTGGHCSPGRLQQAVGSVMDHMGGASDMFMPMAPTGSAAEASTSGSESMGGMMMMMQMWFQATTEVTLWFREWRVDTHGKYAGSIVGLVLLCVLQEGISRTRTAVARQYGAATASQSVDVADPERSALVEAAMPSVIRKFSLSPLVVRLLLSLLYAANLTTSYLLMLAVMTFNVGYFLAIVGGLALGHFIFFPPATGRNPPSMLSEACCPQS